MRPATISREASTTGTAGADPTERGRFVVPWICSFDWKGLAFSACLCAGKHDRGLVVTRQSKKRQPPEPRGYAISENSSARPQTWPARTEGGTGWY